MLHISYREMSTYHIVHSAEQAIAVVDLAQDLRIMLGLMPRPILLTGEAPLSALALLATRDTAEQRLRVPSIVLTEVATSAEH